MTVKEQKSSKKAGCARPKKQLKKANSFKLLAYTFGSIYNVTFSLELQFLIIGMQI